MDEELPFGTTDLVPKLAKGKNGQLRCPVIGCDHWVTPPTRKRGTGTPCPKHDIYVHSSGTYSYADYRRNLLVDSDYFHGHIRTHPFKYEAHRFGLERSEDALSWAVFRSLQRHGLLHEVVRLGTGIECSEEPRLFLWGLEMLADRVEPWDLLIKARERFESDLPVQRPKTEPDIALHLPGQYLVLIEAKFCSPNGVYKRDVETKLLDLTFHQLLEIYSDPDLRILNYEEARNGDKIFYQHWRGLTFAEHMARQDSRDTKAYQLNLVRECHDDDVCESMLCIMRPQYHDRFNLITWEQIYTIVDRHCPKTDVLCRYMETKTAGFRPAFNIPEK